MNINKTVLLLSSLLIIFASSAINAQSSEKTIETGIAFLGDGTKKQVKEKAKVEAIRKAVEYAAGVELESMSRMDNFELTDDMVQTYSHAYVKSIKELSYEYFPMEEKGVYKGEFVVDKEGISKLAKIDKQNKNKPAKKVAASIFFFDRAGRMIENSSTVSEGDDFNVMIQPTEDLYANVINKDSMGNVFRIFPNKAVTNIENPLQSGVQYYLPPSNSELTFTFDSNKGAETFYFILSAEPLVDLDILLERLSQIKGNTIRKKELTASVEKRIMTRGVNLKSTTKNTALIITDDKQTREENKVLEEITGNGVIVKKIILHHM